MRVAAFLGVLLLVPVASALEPRFTVQEREGHLWLGHARDGESDAVGEAVQRFSLRASTGYVLAEVRWTAPAGAASLEVALVPRGETRSVAHAGGAGRATVGWATDAPPAVLEVHVHPASDPRAPALALQRYEVAFTEFRNDVRPAADYSWFDHRLHLEEELGVHESFIASPTGHGIGRTAPWIAALVATAGIAWTFRSRLLALALFSRIEPERLLRHPHRAALLELLRAQGASRVEEARKTLGLANGPFRHHVRLLASAGKVRLTRAMGAAWLSLGPIEPDSGLRDLVKRGVLEHDGASAHHLAKRLGVPAPVVRYHLRNLRRSGEVEARGAPPARRWFLRSRPGNA